MTDDRDTQLGRRQLLAGLGVATVGVAAGPVATVLQRHAFGADDEARPEGRGGEEIAREPQPSDAEEVLAAHDLRPASNAVTEFLGPIAPGHIVEQYWRVEATYDVRAGAIPVVLSTATGHRFLVEMFQHDGSRAPLAVSGPLALFLSNHGNGHSVTDEAAGLGARALGRGVEGRIRDGARVPDGLTTFAQRADAFPNGLFDLPA